MEKGNDINTTKKKRKKVPMYSAEDFFSGKKNANPVGWMSDPDEPGPVILDRKTGETDGHQASRKKDDVRCRRGHR